MSVSFPGSDVLSAAAAGSTVPGFDVLFPSSSSASSAASSPTTAASTTPSTVAPADTYEPSDAAAVPGLDVLFPSAPASSSTASSSPTTTATTTAGLILAVNNPVDLNQPGTVLADGSTVPGDPTGLSSDLIQSPSSTDPFWATDAPSADFNTPIPGFSTLFPSGTETNAAVTIENAASAAPNQYQALDNQVLAASDTQLLSSLGSGSTTTTQYAVGSGAATLSGVSSILSAISAGYNAGVYGGGDGASTIDTTA